MPRTLKGPDIGMLALFDEKPFDVGGFRFHARSVEAIGRPSFGGWKAALDFAEGCADGAAYWHGDLLRYAESRRDWHERMAALTQATGHSFKTMQNRTAIAKRVEEPERRLAPSVGHADAVAALDREDQTLWLTKARDEGWTVDELRKSIRASKRRRIIEGRAVLEGQYRVIVADYPWPYRDSRPTADGSLGKVDGVYPTMTIDEMIALSPKVLAHMETNAVVHFWVPAALLWDRPGPIDVFESLELEYKTNIVWDKVLGMPGHYGTQVCHEHLIVGVRGTCLPDEPLPHLDSVYTERRTNEHSEKPNDGILLWVEQHWTIGPYLYLFGSQPREGWTVFGNDARLWPEQARTA